VSIELRLAFSGRGAHIVSPNRRHAKTPKLRIEVSADQQESTDQNPIKNRRIADTREPTRIAESPRLAYKLSTIREPYRKLTRQNGVYGTIRDTPRHRYVLNTWRDTRVSMAFRGRIGDSVYVIQHKKYTIWRYAKRLVLHVS
jgi:hypothetical protein